MAHPYDSMRKKRACFRSDTLFTTFSSTYADAAYYLGTDYRGQEWAAVQAKYDAGVQQGVLVGLAVTGVGCSDWRSVFRVVAQEQPPFEKLDQEILNGHIYPDWQFFAGRLAMKTTHAYYLPPVAPTYLYTYGITQSIYLDALAKYWERVHEDYYKAWTIPESLEIARIQQIGSEARRKIARQARQAIGSLKR